MGRYFVGVVPEGLAENPEFKRLSGKLKRTVSDREVTARWTPPALFHVTIEFLGELSDSERDQVIATLRTLDLQASEMEVSGLGAFPEADSARVLWLGVSKTKQLEALQAQVSSALKSIGSRDDDEEAYGFVPHITIARFRNHTGVSDLIGLGGRKKFGKYTVGEIVLFESVIENHMKKYVPVFTRKI